MQVKRICESSSEFEVNWKGNDVDSIKRKGVKGETWLCESKYNWSGFGNAD